MLARPPRAPVCPRSAPAGRLKSRREEGKKSSLLVMSYRSIKLVSLLVLALCQIQSILVTEASPQSAIQSDQNDAASSRQNNATNSGQLRARKSRLIKIQPIGPFNGRLSLAPVSIPVSPSSDALAPATPPPKSAPNSASFGWREPRRLEPARDATQNPKPVGSMNDLEEPKQANEMMSAMTSSNMTASSQTLLLRAPGSRDSSVGAGAGQLRARAQVPASQQVPESLDSLTSSIHQQQLQQPATSAATNNRNHNNKQLQDAQLESIMSLIDDFDSKIITNKTKGKFDWSKIYLQQR